MKKKMYPQDQGAFTTVFAACAPHDNPEISHGAYIFPPNVAQSQSAAAMDEAIQKQLFEFTEAMLKEIEV